MNFAKFSRTFFDRTPLDDCFLSLSVNFEKFLRAPLLFSTSEKLQLCHVQVGDFQPAGTVKNYVKGVFKYFRQEREVAIRRRSFT